MSSAVQLATGSETAAMKSLDREFNGFSLSNASGLSSGPGMCLNSCQQSTSSVLRFQAPPTSEPHSTFNAEFNDYDQRSHGANPLVVSGAYGDLQHFATRTCRTGTYILERKGNQEHAVTGMHAQKNTPGGESGSYLESVDVADAAWYPGAGVNSGAIATNPIRSDVSTFKNTGSGSACQSGSQALSQGDSYSNDLAKLGIKQTNDIIDLSSNTILKANDTVMAMKYEFSSEARPHHSDAATRQLNSNSRTDCHDSDQIKPNFPFSSSNQIVSLDESETDSKRKFEIKPFASRPKEPFNLETSNLGFKLRVSLQSDFLSNEFRSCSEHQAKSSGDPSGRDIDKILMDYGLTNQMPLNSNPINRHCTRSNAPSGLGTVNVSENNETNRPLMGSDSIKNQKTSTETFVPSAISGVNFYESLNKNEAPPEIGHKQPVVANWSMNRSQNNETPANNQEQDTVRQYGTPVDYGSYTTAKYQTRAAENLGHYEYGKASAFSGDIGYLKPPSPVYSFADSKSFENPLISTPSTSSKFPSSDITKRGETFSSGGGTTSLDNKGFSVAGDVIGGFGTNFHSINNAGSAAEALSQSLQRERQRLRNIDSMISSTPFYSKAINPPTKPYSSKYIHSDVRPNYSSRDFSGRRLFSTPTIPTYNYRAELAGRTSWSANVDNRNPDSALGKSHSVPAYEKLGVERVQHMGSSVDLPRPGSSKQGVDMQYNNSICRSRQMKIPDTKKSAIKQGPGKKGEFGFVIKSKNPTIQVKNNLKTTSSFMANKPKATQSNMKRQISKPSQSSTGGGEDIDLNVSKTLSSGFDFVKDLNRIWTRSVMGDLVKPPNVKVKEKTPKYKPYKSTTAVERVQNSVTGVASGLSLHRDNTMQPLPQKSQSQWMISKPSGIAQELLDRGVASNFNLATDLGAQNRGTVNTNYQAWKKNNISRSPSPTGKPGFKYTKPQRAESPKSILKLANAKRAVTRPKSAAQSRSNTRPNQLVRGYSPVGSYNPPVTTAKLKPKVTPRATAPAQKKGRQK